MVKYMAPSDYHQRALREGVQVRSPSAILGESDFSSFEELIWIFREKEPIDVAEGKLGVYACKFNVIFYMHSSAL